MINNVQCINDKPLIGNEIGPPLQIGDFYYVDKITKCSCGLEHYDVGLKSEYNWISCRKCSEKLPNGDQIHWCSPERFENVKL